MNIVVVTDNFPIVLAQRKENGYGDISKAYKLNKLFELTNNLFFQNKIQTAFFYITGELNLVDALLRNFDCNVNKSSN